MAFRPVFTEEATKECLDNIGKPLHMLNYGGEDTKGVGKEGVQAAYSMTLMKPKRSKKIDATLVEKLISTDPKDIGLKFIFKECGLGSFGKKKAKYKIHDTFTIPAGGYNGITKATETTMGRWLFNNVVYSIIGYEYVNETLSKKVLNAHFNKIAAKLNAGEIEMDQFKKMKNTYEDFVFRMSSFINPSTTEEMLVLDPKIKKKREELFKKHKEAIDGGELTLVSDIQKELQGMVEERYAESDNMELYKSGATKGGIQGEYTTSMLAIGVVPKGIGTSDFEVVDSNLMDGIKKSDTHTTANTGIIGAYFRGINTANGRKSAGYYRKIMVLVNLSNCLGLPKANVA